MDYRSTKLVILGIRSQRCSSSGLYSASVHTSSGQPMQIRARRATSSITSAHGSLHKDNILKLNFKTPSFREPIKCGDQIRLEHTATQKNLHSHIFASPLSGNQEISAYGENGVHTAFNSFSLIN